MSKVYIDAKDKNVAYDLVHAKTSGNALTHDAAGKEKVYTDELKDMYLKGMVVLVNNADYMKPISYSESAGVGTIVCVKGTGSTPTFSTFTSTKRAE